MHSTHVLRGVKKVSITNANAEVVILNDPKTAAGEVEIRVIRENLGGIVVTMEGGTVTITDVKVEDERLREPVITVIHEPHIEVTTENIAGNITRRDRP